MKKKYSVKDIQHFLLEKGILWNPVGYSDDEFEHKEGTFSAKVQFFGKNVFHEVLIQVDELTFRILKEESVITYEDTTYSIVLLHNFTFDWIEYILKKRPEIAKYIKACAEPMVERTQFLYRKRMEPIEEQIEKLQEQLREMRLKRQETINYWTKVMSLANSVTESEKTSNEDDFVSE